MKDNGYGLLVVLGLLLLLTIFGAIVGSALQVAAPKHGQLNAQQYAAIIAAAHPSTDALWSDGGNGGTAHGEHGYVYAATTPSGRFIGLYEVDYAGFIFPYVEPRYSIIRELRDFPGAIAGAAYGLSHAVSQ